MAEPSGAPSAQEKPKREGNDSLWKRARRTLGASANQLTFMQPQSQAKDTAARTGDASGAGSGKNKRREQVRHAQRTHRQRTQNYIKTLEQEVIRLRGSETSLMYERDKLQSQVDILRTSIILANIPLPAGLEDSPQPGSHPRISANSEIPVTVSYHMDDLEHERLHLDWPLVDAQQNPGTSDFGRHISGTPSGQGRSNLQDFPNDFQFPPLEFSSSNEPENRRQEPKPVENLDSAEVAMDFILALEHPCMHHMPHPSNPSSGDPSMHVLTASMPLVASSPSPPKLNVSTWKIPQANIQLLLNLSSSLHLEGEITPVEAWHQLRQHPKFGNLDRRAIDGLKKDLSNLVRCEGFGSVLDENDFWVALNDVMGEAQY
ncbi:hypothetical protein MMC12_002487 [Toensbergia leucococca]|nr:hypothetical protein [Toensbergia leucococca]